MSSTDSVASSRLSTSVGSFVCGQCHSNVGSLSYSSSLWSSTRSIESNLVSSESNRPGNSSQRRTLHGLGFDCIGTEQWWTTDSTRSFISFNRYSSSSISNSIHTGASTTPATPTTACGRLSARRFRWFRRFLHFRTFGTTRQWISSRSRRSISGQSRSSQSRTGHHPSRSRWTRVETRYRSRYSHFDSFAHRLIFRIDSILVLFWRAWRGGISRVGLVALLWTMSRDPHTSEWDLLVDWKSQSVYGDSSSSARTRLCHSSARDIPRPETNSYSCTSRTNDQHWAECTLETNRCSVDQPSIVLFHCSSSSRRKNDRAAMLISTLVCSSWTTMKSIILHYCSRRRRTRTVRFVFSPLLFSMMLLSPRSIAPVWHSLVDRITRRVRISIWISSMESCLLFDDFLKRNSLLFSLGTWCVYSEVFSFGFPFPF